MKDDLWRFDYINRSRYKGQCCYISDLPQLGVCLYTDSEYFVSVNAMIRCVDMITDDEDIFREKTKDHWAGEKGLFYNVGSMQPLDRKLDGLPCCRYGRD